MFDQLDAVIHRCEELEARLSAPGLYDDPAAAAALLKERGDLEPIVVAARAYHAAEQQKAEAEEMLGDPDLKELAQDELRQAKDDLERLEGELKILLLPRDPNDDKNIIVEIRGGAGGEESALFAHSLMRMYTMYAERNRWKVEVLNLNDTELGGVKEASFSITGEGAYSRLKFESGVHRVQRVPETETQGRGAGGQHVNKTESAIRMTHLPTGIVVECQDERSQFKNREKALKILRSRIYEKKQREADEKMAAQRKLQVGTGDRSERIRTYNYPQSRVSDHRIGLTLYKLDAILDGDLDELIDALLTASQAEKLQQQQEEF